jgi:hypothetical protein
LFDITIKTMDDTAEYARNALRKRRDEAKRKVIAKEFCDGMISGAVTQLYEAQEKNGGRLPHRKMDEVLLGLLDNRAKATRSMLSKRLKSYARPAGIGAEARAPLAAINVNVANQSTVSSLHGVEGVENNIATTGTDTNLNMAGRNIASNSTTGTNPNIKETRRVKTMRIVVSQKIMMRNNSISASCREKSKIKNVPRPLV